MIWDAFNKLVGKFGDADNCDEFVELKKEIEKLKNEHDKFACQNIKLEEKLHMMGADERFIHPCEGCKDFCYLNMECKTMGACANEHIAKLERELFECRESLEAQALHIEKLRKAEVI